MTNILPGSTGNDPATQAHDLAEACIHLDAAVLAQRASADSLNESWSVLRRHLADVLLDAIVDSPGFRLDDAMLRAMDTHFAENALVEQAVRRGWCMTGGVTWQVHELSGHDGILAAITRACAS